MDLESIVVAVEAGTGLKKLEGNAILILPFRLADGGALVLDLDQDTIQYR